MTATFTNGMFLTILPESREKLQHLLAPDRKSLVVGITGMLCRFIFTRKKALAKLASTLLLASLQGGCSWAERTIVLTYDVKSVEPVGLRFTVCGKDIVVPNAEQQVDRKITIECPGGWRFGMEVNLAGMPYQIERDFELEGARRIHTDIRISSTAIEQTYADSAFCPKRDELCGKKFRTGFYSRKDGKYIMDPDSPLLDDRQRKISRETAEWRKTWYKKDGLVEQNKEN